MIAITKITPVCPALSTLPSPPDSNYSFPQASLYHLVEIFFTTFHICLNKL